MSSHADTGPPRAAWAQLEALLESGDLKRAEALLRRHLTDSPDDVRAHHRHGMVCLELGERSAALASLRRALALDPANSLVLNDLGAALEESGDVDAAQETYAQAVRSPPVYPPAYVNHARQLIRGARLDEAEHFLRRAVTEEPGFHRAHCELAALLARRGDEHGALERYRSAMALDEHDTGAPFAAAMLEQDRCRFESAAALLEACLARDPAHLDAALALGACLQELDRMDEALAVYRRVIDIDERRYYDVVKKLTGASRGVFRVRAAALHRLLEGD